MKLYFYSILLLPLSGGGALSSLSYTQCIEMVPYVVSQLAQGGALTAFLL